MKNQLRKAIVLCLSFIPLSVKADYYEMMQEDNYGYGDSGGNNNITLADIGLCLLAFAGAVLIYLAIQFAIDNKKYRWAIIFLLVGVLIALCCFFSPLKMVLYAFMGWIHVSFIYLICHCFHDLYKEIKKDL